MTREEAIKHIKNLLKGREDKRGKTDTDIALDMAIEALEETIKALEQEPCEDAVSRKEVLEVFDEWINSREDWNEHPVWFARSLVSLPSVTPTQRWIPVSERLPEKNVEVLVTTEWDCITIGEMFSNNDWFIHEGATNANIDDIKAWMPLPKPYRAEEEKKQC